MTKIKRIALVAHDNRKADMVEWVEWNWKKLIKYDLICTGTTGKLVNETLLKKMGEEESNETISMKRLKSGPLGGDQQLGALIAEGKVDMLIFLWDPMTPQPHDVDVKPCSDLRHSTISYGSKSFYSRLYDKFHADGY